MQTTRGWLAGLVTGVALAGAAFTMVTPATGVAQPREELKDHWRNFDGHWSYWHAADKRWYYTDGSHWFYHNGKAWEPYRFDKHFGREGFEHGEYKVPPPEAKVVLPRHGVWAPR